MLRILLIYRINNQKQPKYINKNPTIPFVKESFSFRSMLSKINRLPTPKLPIIKNLINFKCLNSTFSFLDIAFIGNTLAVLNAGINKII